MPRQLKLLRPHIAFLVVWAVLSGNGRPVFAEPLAWQVFFSPKGGATDAVVSTLAKAEKRVLVQAYSFTSAPIAKALLEAHTRGVSVEVILDKSQRTERYSS